VLSQLIVEQPDHDPCPLVDRPRGQRRVQVGQVVAAREDDCGRVGDAGRPERCLVAEVADDDADVRVPSLELGIRGRRHRDDGLIAEPQLSIVRSPRWSTPHTTTWRCADIGTGLATAVVCSVACMAAV